MQNSMIAAIRWFITGALVFPWSVNLYSQSAAWTRLHPLPQAHDIIDIQKIPGTNRLITACNYSTILISDNAGETWQTIKYPANLPNHFTPDGLYFLNDHIGFVYGSDFNILKTTDAGLTWSLQYNDPNVGYAAVYDMEFMTDSVGFAITKGHRLLKTTDQGETWQIVYTGYAFASEFIHLEFLGNTVYITTTRGDGVLISSDSGITWQYTDNDEILPGASRISEIWFLNSATGFISADDGIYKTNDAGVNWHRVYYDTAGYFECIFEFIDNDHGIAFTASEYFPCKLLITSDGGETWQTMDSSQKEIYCRDLVYYDQNTLYTGGNKGSMYKSVNGGFNWQLISHNLFKGTIVNPVVLNEQTAVLNELNPAKDTAYIIKTMDGFHTFDTMATVPCRHVFQDKLVEMQFPDASHGICIATSYGNVISYRTSDGGNTWEEKTVLTLEPYNVFHRINFCNPDKGILFSNFILMMTFNGGDSWEQKFLPEHTEVRDMEFASESKLYLFTVYWSGPYSLYVSVDHGDTWQRINYDMPNGHTLYFQDEMTGFLMADKAIYKTTDGGYTWTACTVNAESSWHFSSIIFTSASTGYATGSSDHHNLLKTVDGGETWQPVETPTTMGLTNSQFINDETGYIFNGQEIYKTTNGGGLGIKPPSGISQTFNAYPNPFTSALRIDVTVPPITTPYQMSVFNNGGQLLYTTSIQPQAESILYQGSMLTPGIYFIRFSCEDKVFETVKVVKQ